MTVNRQRIIGSEAESRERLGPLPWLVSETSPQRRMIFPAGFGHFLAIAAAACVAFLLLRCGL